MKNQKQANYNMMLFAIIASIFVTSIDVGIVAPARTTIAASLKVSDTTSVWIMTSYSLAFAASMLIWGILSDKYGKKRILLISLTMFIVSSVLCGITNQFSSFSFMITARALQGFFGGGLIPVATSYIATEFPMEKKGLAMGLVGATFSIGSVVGPTAGSALIDWLGSDNWGWLFYINIFFGLIAIPTIFKYLKETVSNRDLKIEFFSITSVSASILCIMLFFTNVDFSGNIAKSLSKLEVYLPLIGFVVFAILTVVFTAWLKGPLFIIKDLFKNKTMALSLLSVSVVAISLFSISLYLPQISETFFRLVSGKGGYYSTIIGIAGVIFGPIAGNMIGKIGPKKLLQLFAVIELLGFILFYMTLLNGWEITYYISLFIIGMSQSAIIGLAYNFFIQLDVEKSMQANAQSILALFRSVFGSIAPSISIIFLKPAINNTASIAKTKSKEIKDLVVSLYKSKITNEIKPVIAHVKTATTEKVKALMMSGQGTPAKIAELQSSAKLQILNASKVAKEHAKTAINLPKFNKNLCSHLNSVHGPLKHSITSMCDATRHSMLSGFSTIALVSIIGIVILIVISFFFKNYDMKSLINKENNRNETRAN